MLFIQYLSKIKAMDIKNSLSSLSLPAVLTTPEMSYFLIVKNAQIQKFSKKFAFTHKHSDV